MAHKTICMNNNIIYPRSPREEMCGWMYLPRFIDKIRLNLAEKLHPDYQENFTKGFDRRWLDAAGIDADAFISVVKNSVTDGEVCDWIRKHVKKTDTEKKAFRDFMLIQPKPDDSAGLSRLKDRKEKAGMAHRDDIKTAIDFIDADEKRF